MSADRPGGRPHVRWRPVRWRPVRWRPVRWRRYATPLALLALWQALSGLGLIPARTLASPAAVARAFADLTATGELPRHVAASLARVAAGLVLGVGAGTALALAAGLSRRGEDLLDATLQMLRTLPFLALVPLFIVWFGIGETPKVALVALGSLFPVYLTLFAGIRGVDPRLVEAGRSLGLTRAELVRHVVLPGALPSGLVGLRYAFGTAWLSLVVAEQINAETGIGAMINQARDFLRTDVILVGLILYALMGLASDRLVGALERRALAWRPGGLAETA